MAYEPGTIYLVFIALASEHRCRLFVVNSFPSLLVGSLQVLADEQLIVSRASLVGKGTGFGED